MRIRISWTAVTINVTLNDSLTASKVFAAAPFSSTSSTWGEEVYFKAPIEAELEPTAQQIVDPGTVCYWIQGESIALPYGATPISKGEKSMLIARANIIGNIEGDPRVLKSIKHGEAVRIERIEG